MMAAARFFRRTIVRLPDHRQTGQPYAMAGRAVEAIGFSRE
jgi:hypothetical protein